MVERSCEIWEEEAWREVVEALRPTTRPREVAERMRARTRRSRTKLMRRL